MSNTLSFELNKTADWRLEKSKLYSHDIRNSEAAVKLTRLADQSAGDDVSQRYDSLQDDEDVGFEKLANVHSEVLSAIGFSWEPTHVDEVLRRIVEYAKA